MFFREKYVFMKNLEIERKFLVEAKEWSSLIKPEGIRYIQGYLCIDSRKVIRIRVAADTGYLTIKGKSTNFSRPEFEYIIPAAEANEMIFKFTDQIVEKVRFRIPIGAFVFEIDEFIGLNAGLVLAEIELMSPDDEFDHPAWLGQEVTQDPRYYNSYLSKHPYSTWKK